MILKVGAEIGTMIGGAVGLVMILKVGAVIGTMVGEAVGLVMTVGVVMDGTMVGEAVGLVMTVGVVMDGTMVGEAVGLVMDGIMVGDSVGVWDGTMVGVAIVDEKMVVLLTFLDPKYNFVLTITMLCFGLELFVQFFVFLYFYSFGFF